nr:type II secretion system F family protein [Candidatus Halobonum tyrrellensis]
MLAPFGLALASRRASLAVTRVALAAFGDYVAERSRRRRRQRERLRAAHVGTTHRAYASRTLLYAAVAGVSGSLLGVYALALLLALLRVSAEAVRAAVPPALSFLGNLGRLPALGVAELFPLFALSAATVGAGAALGTYHLRWFLLDQRASARAGRVESTLPRTVAFLYALSRSGMSFPAVLDTLTDNETVYGEAARELGVAVREVNNFGTDTLTALEHLSERTPAASMADLSDNLVSVLGSGRSLPEFLRGQYERYQEEAAAQQEQYLELLEAFAEAYVTVLVAGPLFFVTILVVIGLVLQDTLDLIRVVVYLGVPLASAGFVVFLDSMTSDHVDASRREATADPRLRQATRAVESASADTGARADGGAVTDRWAASRGRLALYRRSAWLREWTDRPLAAVSNRPAATLPLTVPLGLAWVLFRTGALPLAPVPLVRAVDAPVVEAVLFVLVAFALVYETGKRRTRAVERAVPDFLDRMASLNDAGMTVVGSLKRLTRSDLDRLTPEVRRTWRDIEWGADAATALHRLDARVDSPMMSRAVALITNAMAASGDVAPVLEIAADEARATRRLRRERRQVMVTYLLVIYISFLVFLGIIAALTVSFIPAVQSAAGASGGAGGGLAGAGMSGGTFSGLGSVDTAAYSTLFYHASAIQAVCSGLVAGQLGEGSVSDGAKHAVLMLLAAYLTFVFIA